MKKLIMTKGLPASGKSTWAKEYLKDNPNTIRVNKDELRAMLHNGVWSQSREQFILNVRNFIIDEGLKNGHDVIVDDTNFAPKHEAYLREVAKKEKAEFIIQDFSNVDVDECIKRDLNRANGVGVEVIRKMYNQYLKPIVQPVAYDKNLTDVILCDIDGTLAIAQAGANMYDRDFTQDIPNEPIIKYVQKLLYEGKKVLFVSGRKDKYRKQTVEWLSKQFFNAPLNFVDTQLFMRADGDMRKDVLVKKEIYENSIKGKFNVTYVLDDRNQTVRGWRELGLTCFQVAEGDF